MDYGTQIFTNRLEAEIKHKMECKKVVISLNTLFTIDVWF